MPNESEVRAVADEIIDVWSPYTISDETALTVARAAITAIDRERAAHAEAEVMDQAMAIMSRWLPLGATICAPTVNGMATGPESEFGKQYVSAMQDDIRALLALLQPRAVEITEDMVEQACRTFFQDNDEYKVEFARLFVRMRAALEAALAPAPEEDGHAE